MDDYYENPQMLNNVTKEQRMNMIQQGYNPLDEESVSRYFNNEPSKKEMAEVVAESKREDLGSGRWNDSRDYAAIEGGNQGVDPFDQRHGDPKTQMGYSMDDYGYGGGTDINEAVRTKLGTGGDPRQTHPRQNDRGNQYASGQQNLNEDRRYVITEDRTAATIGYQNGSSYLTAFINLVRDPSGESRQAFFERVDKLLNDEQAVHPQMLKFYRGGCAKAERQFYEKLNANVSGK